MNISKVIENVKRKKQGYNVTDEFIINCINRVEAELICSVVINREGEETVKSNYGNYSVQTKRDKELLALAPFDSIYEVYCCSQLDLEYEDSERYQNDLIAYNTVLEEFKKFWIAGHRQRKRYNWHI